jgi:hypothetical protein
MEKGMKTNKDILEFIINNLNIQFNSRSKITKEKLIECWSAHRKETDHKFYGYASEVSRQYKSIFKNVDISNKGKAQSWKSYILSLYNYKLCCICHNFISTNNFHHSAQSIDGLKYSCKSCDTSRGKVYNVKNKEYIKEQKALYYIENKDKINCMNKKYYQNNKASFIAKDAKRRAAKLKRTPKWLTEEDQWMFKEIYSLAKLREELTGGKMACRSYYPFTRYFSKWITCTK